MSERLVSQFLAADVVVVGAPMYNFSVPSHFAGDVLEAFAISCW